MLFEGEITGEFAGGADFLVSPALDAFESICGVATTGGAAVTSTLSDCTLTSFGIARDVARRRDLRGTLVVTAVFTVSLTTTGISATTLLVSGDSTAAGAETGAADAAGAAAAGTADALTEFFKNNHAPAPNPTTTSNAIIDTTSPPLSEPTRAINADRGSKFLGAS